MDNATGRLADCVVGCMLSRARRSCPRSLLGWATTRGWPSRLTRASVSPGSSASIICAARARAAWNREGDTSVACIDAEASTRTIVLRPVDSLVSTNGRAMAAIMAARAAIWRSSSTLGGTRRQGRWACRSFSAASHKKVLETRREGRRGRSRYVARMARRRAPPTRNAPGARKPTSYTRMPAVRPRAVRSKNLTRRPSLRHDPQGAERAHQDVLQADVAAQLEIDHAAATTEVGRLIRKSLQQ